MHFWFSVCNQPVVEVTIKQRWPIYCMCPQCLRLDHSWDTESGFSLLLLFFWHESVFKSQMLWVQGSHRPLYSINVRVLKHTVYTVHNISLCLKCFILKCQMLHALSNHWANYEHKWSTSMLTFKTLTLCDVIVECGQYLAQTSYLFVWSLCNEYYDYFSLFLSARGKRHNRAALVLFIAPPSKMLKSAGSRSDLDTEWRG